MPKVKIISDSYRRETQFQLWDEDWVSVSEDNNPNSALHAEQYAKGFFPFKAQEILVILLREYGDHVSPLEIVFEGPDDEWRELVDACVSSGLDDQIVLTQGNRTLENARDVLPFIRSKFEEVHPVIAGYADSDPNTQEHLRKFKDASSDVVPIVVVGNYSTGKSTFINALIGVELLPVSDQPTTARIFRIGRSSYEDRASVKFKLGDVQVVISFTDDETRVNRFGISSPLTEAIDEAIAHVREAPIIERVRVAIEAINTSKAQDDGPVLADLIEIEIPFGKSVAWARDKRIAIFDTPGSNSNSNIDHARVLADAMRGMSDGLPIYVTCHDGLDSNDNADLYETIQQMPALDERFAMIVVNKADRARLPKDGFTEDQEDTIMSTGVARNLFAQGIFFVSSIVALGAKTGGSFEDRFLRRDFRLLKDIYGDPEDEDYTRLYDYDLMPGQLRDRMVQQAAACTNLLLANSGIFSIEKGIEEFATKYSAYNKCFQSEQLLRELIEQTDVALEASSKRAEKTREHFEDEFGDSRDKLFRGLNDLAYVIRNQAQTGYFPCMNEWAKTNLPAAELTMEEVTAWEQAITARKRYELNAEERRKDAEGKHAAVGANFSSKMQDLWDTKNFLGIAGVMQGLATDIGAAFAADGKAGEVFRGADREASEELLRLVRERFERDLTELCTRAESCSKEYWEGQALRTRKELLDYVSAGDTLDDKQRKVLRETIIGYQELTFEADELGLIALRYPFDPNKLWKQPLTLQYNLELKKRISMWRDTIGPLHVGRYQSWLGLLVEELEDHAVDLNPELRERMDELRATEVEIESLKAKRERLREVEELVSQFMDWREA